MVDHTDDTKPFRRIEVISGAGRRRRWSNEEKARIVAESFAPGAIVAEVARRHDARAQQVHGWRRDAREGRLVLPADTQALERISFAPVIVAEPAPTTVKPTPERSHTLRSPAPTIEIEADGVAVRIGENANVNLIEAVLRILRRRT